MTKLLQSAAGARCEKRLLLSALGGATGMLAGMLMLRHKTRHVSFRIVIPLLAIAQFVGGLLLYRYS